MTKLEETRRDYSGPPLDESEMAPDPLAQFHRWYDEARGADLMMANAMALATATPDGMPSVRMVLLKQADPRGFVWYTNYESRKGLELLANPRAALLFYWETLARQVRVEGPVTRLDPAESEAYFHARPRAANLSAIASPQSRSVASRAALEEQVDRLEAAWHGRELERPVHWGGHRLRPTRFEFWQGREDRMHDRVVYLPDGHAWRRSRIAP
jgi:pyridoxamine 5'-phosphate oxidase